MECVEAALWGGQDVLLPGISVSNCSLEFLFLLCLPVPLLPANYS